MLYPMYTLPLQILMDMTTVSPHEELRDAGFVVEFEQSMGRALFVSHQWLGWSHPDPKGQQIQVLKEACANILSGKSRISAPPGEELEQGYPKTDSKTMFLQKRLFLWYDYFCCPQKSNAADMKLAIDSIPTYIARCELFVILCSEAEHVERGLGTDLSTWAERGWCRIECMARELSAGNTTMISIESPSLQTYEPPWQAAFFPPGEGRFSSQGDRDKVAAILKQIFGAKLLDCLAKEDLCSYRFWLNQKRMRFSGFNVPDSEVVAVLKQQVAAKLVHCLEQEDMVAYHFWLNQQQVRFNTKDIEEKSGEEEYEATVLARFLHENSFTHATERDAAGWSPLCYAAMNGNPLLVSALLSARADANDRITKGRPECQIQKGMPVLQLSAYCRNCDVMKLLLSARAAVNDSDCRGATALHWAMISNTAQGVRILCEAGADAELISLPATAPLACTALGSADALRELLVQRTTLDFKDALHFSLMFRSGVKSVSVLLEARADPNQPLQPTFGSSWWKVLQVLSLRHRLKSSRLSSLAYNHAGATPLMFSILAENYEAAALLVAAGARPEIRSARNKSAHDLARDISAPSSVMQLLQGELVVNMF